MLDPPRREQIKLALALHRQLPDCNPSGVFPPAFYWERYCQAARRVNRVFVKNWPAALPVALEELERVSESLVQQVRSIVGLAKAEIALRSSVSLRDILLDLEALDDEFPEVRWDRQEKTLSVVTEPVELKGVELGRFEILLEYSHLGRTKPYRILALDPNPAAADSTTTHPHVRDEDLCEGDGRAPIQKALRQGRFYDVFVLINQILHSYNKDSPYVSLSHWEGTRCPGCGSTVSDDDTTCCEECHAATCSDCSSSCSKCYRSLCSGCQDRCGACSDTFCRDCLAGCPGCSDDYCASCLENGRCEDCRELDPDEDEEADEEVPSELEVQPVRLGQAAVPEGPGTD